MRVLVAMSGGVDSSVAAALLLDQGHDVVGCTLQLWGGASDSGCCSAADVDDARRVAQVLGIDHHVFSLAEEFQRGVVDPYVAAHASGATPNPCVACNRTIKFDALLARADRLGFDVVATGHHARVTWGDGGPELRRGSDRSKDQSYVLGFLAAEVLTRVRFPVGDMTKVQVRQRAGELGMRTADKPDSQEVCFIPRGGRRGFLEERTPLSGATIVDMTSGEPMGELAAAQLVTVGQRRGIGHGPDGQPRYVSRIDVKAKQVHVGRRDEVLIDTLALDATTVSWPRDALGNGAPVLLQTSAHGAAARGTLAMAHDLVRVELDERVRPVAVGQLAVFYDPSDPDVVVGAATVASAVPVRA